MSKKIATAYSTSITWHDMSTAPLDLTYVLLLCQSGYVTIDDVIVTGKYNHHKRRWEDHCNDALMDGGLAPRKWAELPIGHQ